MPGRPLHAVDCEVRQDGREVPDGHHRRPLEVAGEGVALGHHPHQPHTRRAPDGKDRAAHLEVQGAGCGVEGLGIGT